MIGYAKDLTKYKLGDSIGFPSENTTDMLNEVGSVVIPKTLSSNVLEVHKFLFGSDGYSVSSTIEGIESGITAKASDKAKSGTTIEDDETPGSKGYSENYSNNSSGTGTTRSTYGTTGGSTYGTGSYMVRQTDIPEEHRREAERPEVQAALPQELREQPGGTEGQQQEVERPEIMQAALREPLDRQKERNK